MLNRIITFKLFLLLTALSQTAVAKSWRDITPLRSTAQDVAKLSPDCAQAQIRCQFTMEGHQVMIVFSGSKIGDMECERIPEGTVLAVFAYMCFS